MAATTMQHISKLKDNIINDYTQYTFVPGRVFSWDPTAGVISYKPLTSPESIWSLIHEVAHGELRHITFTADIDLLRSETAAWHYAAQTIAPAYKLSIDQDYIEDHLDTYRAWLHRRSLCPTCHQNGLQQTQNTYSCLNCRCLWRVNEARLCRLQRTRLQGQSRSELAAEQLLQ